MSLTTSATQIAERPTRKTLVVTGLLVLAVIYLVLQVVFVQPYLWPAGHGAIVAGDSRFVGGSGDARVMLARPPSPTDHPIGATIVLRVAPDSPAARAGVRQGDEILAERHATTGAFVDLRELMMAEPAGQLAIWRKAYDIGLRGPLVVSLARIDGGEAEVTLDRPTGWRSPPALRSEWMRRHFGLMIQLMVFVGSALVLFLLRSRDATAALTIAALALCGVGAAGSLLGGEGVLPTGLRQILTVFSWIAAPLAFPITCLAILYFPTRAERLSRQPWIQAVPFIAAAPMLVTSTLTGLYVAGIDALAPAAVWDAQHDGVFYTSFMLALMLNVAAIVEGTWRFRGIADVNERNRIRLVVMTTVPGVLAYAVRVGVPALSRLGGTAVELPWALDAALQVFVLLPAFALTYAVAVHRVLAPRLVVRRSIQYALARKTLTIIAVLPAAALLASLVRQRDMTLGDIVTGAPLFYTSLIVVSVAAFRYRDRARAWLDQRFFREEYDAQKILVSLVSRVRFETDPSELTTLVVSQIDAALHPETTAILISGIEENSLTPVTVLNGSVETLPLDGGLVSMLRWSDEPLELYLDDPKSPAHRLPPAEREWLECTAAVLLVPIIGEERALVGVIVLAPKRSEEPYTAEDRQLLANIASQVGLGLDVARLRRRLTDSTSTAATTIAAASPIAAPLAECPRCGRCEEATVSLCPTDGAALVLVPSVPRVIDDKYRVDQLLGRGGMGGVYRAHDVRLDRDVAIKVVRAELLGHPEARRRFRREAQIVARLQHPSIVSVFDYGTFADGSAYLVMEFVRGDDLRRALKRAGAFEPREAVRLMTAICTAIEAAHREGILHRDLKPENVLMPGSDVDVKILDFGVAKLLDTGAPGGDATVADSMMTMEGSVVGTPAYMAPEQLKGGAVDGRTDVFGLGVMTYEMLTGRLPFGTGSIAEIAVRQMQPLAPLGAPGRPVPPRLEDAIVTALQSNPALRPPSPLALANLLQEGLKG